MLCQKADQSLYHYKGVRNMLVYSFLQNAGMVLYLAKERLNPP